MPRGGRRRGRGRRRRPAAAPAQQAPESRSQAPAKPAAGRRRRRRGRGTDGGASALERMAGVRPKSVQTLPADGIVLEDLVSQLRDEYGTPTTPQEYRLLIKIPSAEGEAPPPEPEDSEEAPDAQPSPATMGERPPRRRRRRGGRVRRPTGGGGEPLSQPTDETSL